MPCRDYEDDFSRSHSVNQRNTELAAMLCACCLQLEAYDINLPSTDCIEWWQLHKKNDAIALAAEIKQKKIDAVRENALRKLSTLERDILGV